MTEHEMPDFSLPDLIDLALCSPEVGAVNFNILRIFLHELLRKLGYDQEPAHLDDLQAHQIQNFKNYIQGAGTASPMPGVLRYQAGHQFAAKTPRTPKAQSQIALAAPGRQDGGGSGGPDSGPVQPSGPKGFVGDPNKNIQSGPKGTWTGGSTGGGGGSGSGPGNSARDPGSGNKGELEKKVARLEQHLEALYALPTNQQILGDKDNTQGMSVNDMWQIIQLNNRVAAAEAAIQKMASLIEDLAREMKSVKADGMSSRKDLMKMDSLIEKLNAAQKATSDMRKDLENVKSQTKNEMDKLQKATGVDIAKAPSFMKLSPSGTPTEGQKPAGTGPQSAGQQATVKPSTPSQGQGNQKPEHVHGPGHAAHVAQDQHVHGPGHAAHVGQAQGQHVHGPGHAAHAAQDQSGPVSGPGPSQSKTKLGQRQGQAKPQGQPGQNQGQEGKPQVQGQGQGGVSISQSKTQIQPGQGQSGQGQSGQGGAGQGQAKGQTQPSTGTGGQAGGPPAKPGQGQVATTVSQSQLGPGGAQPGKTGQSPSGQSGQSGQGGPSTTPQGGTGKAGSGQDGAGQKVPVAAGQGQQGQQPGAQQQGLPGQGEPPASTGQAQRPSASGPGQAGPGGVGGTDVTQPGAGTTGGNQAQAQPTGQATGGKYPTRPSIPLPADSHGTAHGHSADVSTSHPAARHHEKHVPVDVINKPLTGVIHQDHAPGFQGYQGPPPLEEEPLPGTCDPLNGPSEMVQKVLQAQYAKLQGMQRQMATEIQDKMEFIYQKLLREIENQHMTTAPYMAMGANADKCLGPGVCAGHGMPADTAVCQFPQATQEKYEAPCAGPAYVPQEKELEAQPGVCPGQEVCPACRGDILHQFRSAPPKKDFLERDMDAPKSGRTGHSTSLENLIRQGTTSMVLLPRDLEELREKVKNAGRIPDIFNELDVLEKLEMLWEAVNILKSNEESMAVRIVKQDALLQKVPVDAMEKLKKISAENLEALAAAAADGPFPFKTQSQAGIPNLEDLQMIFSNLSNLMLDNSSLKERFEKFGEALRDLEMALVTKPMLVDAMSDKADKGQMNLKVSYDEFGNAVDELTTRLQNLLLEVYQKNELWKQVTEKQTETLSEKLDKSELGPLRDYFKIHLSKLQAKVNHLTQLMEEPDPAGTRKKLLKDFNCISCDRYTSISGVTNGPTLPILGPILAGHTTASQRAFELHRMRQMEKNSRYDPEGQNYVMMEKQNRGDESARAAYPSRTATGSGKQSLQDSDVLNLVNRYVGGSHTTVSNKERVSVLHTKRPSTAFGTYNAPEPEDRLPVRPVTSYYDYEVEEE